MLYPSVDDLMKKLDSKYTLVTLAAKRARELRNEKKSFLEKPQSHKYVGIALEEFLADNISCEEVIENEKAN